MRGIFRRRFQYNIRRTLVAGKAAPVLRTTTASLEALAQIQGALATTALTAAGQTSFSISAALEAAAQKRLTATATLEAAAQKAITATANLEAAAQKAMALTAPLEAVAQTRFTVTGSLEALAQKNLLIVASLDAIAAPVTSLAAIPPDVILASTNLSGLVANIRDDPDAPDASWLTAPSATAATDIRVSFPTPPGT
jgi:hypothetical protein